MLLVQGQTFLTAVYVACFNCVLLWCIYFPAIYCEAPLRSRQGQRGSIISSDPIIIIIYHNRGVIDPGLSDHAMVFTTHKYQRQSREKETKCTRDYCHFNHASFNLDINKIDWSDLKNCSSVDETVAILNFEFLSDINRHMPMKRLRTRCNSAKWITSEYYCFVDWCK